MASENRQHQPPRGETEDQQTIPMDDQGASYSSSYNESTPGEVVADRRRALHAEDADATHRSEDDAPSTAD